MCIRDRLTLSPSFLLTGIGSPEIIDSPTVVLPSVVIPSTGILSSGFTRRISPFSILSMETFSSVPSTTRMALLGASFKSSFTAELVLLCARLQYLAHQHQRQDYGGGFKIDMDRPGHCLKFIRKDIGKEHTHNTERPSHSCTYTDKGKHIVQVLCYGRRAQRTSKWHKTLPG